MGLNVTAVPRSLKPHLITAIRNWCIEKDYAPFIMLDVSVKKHEITPLDKLERFVNNNQLVFNVSLGAVVDYSMEGDVISFGARFGGIHNSVKFPIDSVTGIFSRDTKIGFFFPVMPAHGPVKEEKTPPILPPPPKGKPTLTIVK